MIRMLAAVSAVFSLFWQSTFAFAQELASPVESPLASLGKLAIAMIFVLLVFWVFVKFMKKMQVRQGGTHNDLNIVGSLSVGPRERIVVVQAGSEQILLGITPTQINTLHTLKTPLVATDMAKSDAFEKRLT